MSILIPVPVPDSQHGFRISGYHADQGRYPHPEQGAWSSRCQRGCHPCYIACAHSSGQRGADRLELADSLSFSGPGKNDILG